MRQFSRLLTLSLALSSIGLLPQSVIAEVFVLSNGDSIDATVIEETDETIVVEHPQLGRVVLERSGLKPPDPPAPPNPGLFGTRFLEGWSRNISAGFSGSSGNSNDASVNGSIALSRSTDDYRSAFNSSYFYASQNGASNTNEFFANYQHDFTRKDSSFYPFVKARYQHDVFQAWSDRVTASGGGGYDLLQRETLHLRGELGVGFSRSWGSERAWRPEGVASLVLEWNPADGQQLTADITYYPDFDDLGEFRALANTAYLIAITQLDGLSLKLGAKNEYDSNQPGDNNNLKYYGNLVYDF
jgi:putative salt-induced outer membrane protein YdiY